MKRINSAFAGENHDALPAPAWDYANALRLDAESSSFATALSEGLWLFRAENDDVYYKIGDATLADPVANGDEPGSIHLPVNQPWGETVVGSNQKIAVIRKSTDAVLWAIPAKTVG